MIREINRLGKKQQLPDDINLTIEDKRELQDTSQNMDKLTTLIGLAIVIAIYFWFALMYGK